MNYGIESKSNAFTMGPTKGMIRIGFTSSKKKTLAIDSNTGKLSKRAISPNLSARLCRFLMVTKSQKATMVAKAVTGKPQYSTGGSEIVDSVSTNSNVTTNPKKVSAAPKTALGMENGDNLVAP
jgi:pseudouridine-5'-phosphate glycosidase